MFHILPPKTCSLNISKKCQKYGKLQYIFSLLLQGIFFVKKFENSKKNAGSTSETKQNCIITHVLTNLKTWNSKNAQFFEFLRLPLSIQKYLIAYYTIKYNFSFAVHKTCAYFSLGIRMKDSQNETTLFLLHNMRLPCWKMRNPSAGTRWYRNLEWPSYYFLISFYKSYSWRNRTQSRESCNILLYSLWLPQRSCLEVT